MKLNYVSLIGTVRQAPKALAKGTQAMFMLHVIRRDIYNSNGLYTPHYDQPVILAADKYSVDEIMKIRPNDIVMVKGTVNTRNMTWNFQCPECKELFPCTSTLATVYPAPRGIKILERPGTIQYAEDYLRTVPEFSNIAVVQGRVCVPPTCHVVEGKGTCTYYQLAVNRKLYVIGSKDEEDHTDYPWIYSFGKQAEEDALALSVGSMLLVDGYLHTNKHTKTVKCPYCGATSETPVSSMNITPYSCEYGEGCNKPESTLHGSKEVDVENLGQDITEE